MPDQPEPKGLTEAELDELWNVASDKHKRREIGELTLKRLVHQARLFLAGQRRAEEAEARAKELETELRERDRELLHRNTPRFAKDRL